MKKLLCPNHKFGFPLLVELIRPDGVIQTFEASLTNSGDYKAVFTIDDNSLIGPYGINLSHNGLKTGSVSFKVLTPSVPDWVKNNAKWWSSNVIPDSEFIDGLENLIDDGIIRVPSSQPSTLSEKIPDWIKKTAKWWSNDEITNDDFILAIEFLIKKGIIRI